MTEAIAYSLSVYALNNKELVEAKKLSVLIDI
jgi:hypothetical protein